MTGFPEEKEVAGLRCGQVLERLSDYLDDDLAPEDRGRLEAHLRGCEGCARFGGQLGATVRALRAHLGAGRLPGTFRERLRAAIDRDDDA